MKLQRTSSILNGAFLLAGMIAMPAIAQQGTPPPPASPRDARPMPPPLPEGALRQGNNETHSYKLRYTIVEIDGAKEISTKNYELALDTRSPHNSLKLGSKIPILVGQGMPTGQNSGIQYIDIGINIEAKILESPSNVELQTKVEQSSIADETAGVQKVPDPVIRQASIQTIVLMVAGKPTLLGSVDLPGTTHHLKIEVTMTRMQ